MGFNSGFKGLNEINYALPKRRYHQFSTPDVVTSKYQQRYENHTWVSDVTITKGKRISNRGYIIQSCAVLNCDFRVLHT